VSIVDALDGAVDGRHDNVIADSVFPTTTSRVASAQPAPSALLGLPDPDGYDVEPSTGPRMEAIVSRWVVLLHVAVAFWFVAGLIGRNLALARARSRQQVGLVEELVELAGGFERLMVIPGSFAVLLLGLLAAWAQGRSLAGSGNGWLLVSLLLYVPLFAMVPLVFLPRGRVFDRALGDARERGAVTPALASALRDPVVAAARALELVVVAVILALVVVKPF
jgi:hypothetical protein